MFSQLKAPPSIFRQWMLSCNSEYLKDDFLKQLEKSLPTTEELKALANFQNEINDLQYSEQYFSAVHIYFDSCSLLFLVHSFYLSYC